MNQNPKWEGSSRTGDWLFGAVKRNPEGLLLLAAGCALLMRTGARREGRWSERGPASRYDQRDRYPDNMSPRSGSGRAASGLSEGVSQVAETAKEYATGMKDSVSTTASSYAASASEYAEEARRSVTEHSGRITREAQSTLQNTISRVIHDQPLAVAILGLAAGAAVAAVLPASDLEKKTLGPAGEKLSDVASKAGEQLKEATAKAGERLKSAAEERGLDAEGLKEVAQEVAGEFGSAFAGEKKQPGQAAGPNSSGSPSKISQTAGPGGSLGQPSRSLGASSPAGGTSDQLQRTGGSGSQTSPSPAGSGLSDQRGASSSPTPGPGPSGNEPGSVAQKMRGPR